MRIKRPASKGASITVAQVRAAVRRIHAHDMWDEMPNIGGQGSLHSLESQEAEPRLWFAKSVSRAGAQGLAKRDEPQRQPIGFRTR